MAEAPNTASPAQLLAPMVAALSVFVIVSAGGLSVAPGALLGLGDSMLAGVIVMSLAAGVGCGVGCGVAYALVPPADVEGPGSPA